MKRMLASAVLVAGILAGGCSDKSIHTDQVRAAFQSVPPEQRVKLDTGLKELDSSNYVAALPQLQSFAFGTKMNDDQRKILTDTIAKVSVLAEKK